MFEIFTSKEAIYITETKQILYADNMNIVNCLVAYKLNFWESCATLNVAKDLSVMNSSFPNICMRPKNYTNSELSEE